MSHTIRRFILLFIASALTAGLIGCTTDTPMNPSFPITLAEAKQVLREMHEHPKPLARPVIVTAGYLDPGLISGNMARRFRRATSADAPILNVSFFCAPTFDACREKLIERVERAFPSADPHLTTEVDVIGFSMGGLVARYAASPRPDGEGKRLNIKRLFTVGTPHRGARLAPLGFFDRRAIAMRADSDFIAALNEDLSEGRYEVLPYVRLRDAIVGQENAAPPGTNPWWVPNKFITMAHTNAGADERIIADIARRLRNEEPLTQHPPPPGIAPRPRNSPPE